MIVDIVRNVHVCTMQELSVQKMKTKRNKDDSKLLTFYCTINNIWVLLRINSD